MFGLPLLMVDLMESPRPEGTRIEALPLLHDGSAELVQAVNADLNRLGVVVGDTVDVFGAGAMGESW